MAGFTVYLPAKWQEFLRRLANDHQVELNDVINELCEWAFSNSEGKIQFKLWLDSAYPPRGEAEDKDKNENEEMTENEEEKDEKSEGESHAHRD